MKRCGLFIIILISTAVQGQSILPGLVQCSPHKSSVSAIDSRISSFVESLKHKNQQSEVKFLHSVFRNVHRAFLKQYQPYSQFNELIEQGKYDCLSATALLSLVLTDLKFDFKIIETNYHIFLLVNTAEGEVLLETTDRFSGFETSPEKIENRIGNYKQNLLATTQDNAYLYHFNLYHQVMPDQLVGLLVFNQAVVAFNQRDWMTCSRKLELSESIYPSERIEELASLLWRAVNTGSVDEATKAYIAQHHQKHIKKSRPSVAAR